MPYFISFKLYFFKPVKRRKKETDLNREGQSHDDADDEDEKDENESMAGDNEGLDGEGRKGKKIRKLKDVKLKLEGKRGVKRPKRGMLLYSR